MNMTLMKRFAILALLPALGACTPMGPRALQATRPLYNEAVASTNDQELLLNLVRIRYRDTTYFTTVERIAASLELNMSIGASGTYSNTASTAAKNTVGRILNVGPGSIALNEKPTIFYAPIEGEKFVRQMMTPMNADVLLLLVRSGWSIDRVLTLGVIEMNGLKNAPTASGPAPSREPEYKDFIEAVHLLRMLQRENKLDLSKSGEKGGLELRFIRGSAMSPQAARFKTLAGVAADADRIRIEVGAQPSDDHALALTTRPVMAALNYLATGVDVPAADMAAGKVRQTVHADGTPFNWQEMLDGVFRVRVAAKEPEDASTKIQYRGSWFYIADDDLDAKSTFVLLTQIIALHSVSPTTVAPLISIGK